ncbi:MAG: hypothetical protein WAV27_04005 [Xanthobacteraceae bacterium]|jgi:hypothetical protein
MKTSRPFLVAGTIFSGVAAVAPGQSVYAQTSHGLVLAQAAPANPAEAKPTTNQDIFRTILREVQPVINECRLRRLRGELPTFAASAECSNHGLISSFNAAHYKYMDLIRFLVAKRLEVAEQIDRKEVTEDQARRESMKIMIRVITAVQERDSGAR